MISRINAISSLPMENSGITGALAPLLSLTTKRLVSAERLVPICQNHQQSVEEANPIWEIDAPL